MIYLIGQLFVWLLLTAAAAAVAGWLYATQRGQGARLAQRRERERLIRDLGRLAGGASSNADDLEADRARNEAADALSRVRESRIAELERAVETARARNDELTSEAAELRRQLDGVDANTEELTRLRALSATLEAERAREIEAVAEPVVEQDDTTQLMAWRLRYFEQRARYLESQPRPVAALPPPAAATPEPPPVSPLPEWRAREAAARADYLENELRALRAAPVEEAAPEPEPEPFAANADVNVLLRWRMLYLERRVAHLQAQAAAAPEPVEPETPPAPVQDSGPDPDMWKWRARYLEARVRHLEQRPAVAAPQPVAATLQEAAEAPAPTRPAPRRGAKPPVLSSARNGAPDDFTLIESISQLQQTTLNALGIYHYDQIAAWTPEHVAWIDNYLRLQGRIDQEEWLEQAGELAQHGPSAARRVLEDEDA
jgi:predicted flap endonuclease-1-like 5' DNA nuclease